MSELKASLLLAFSGVLLGLVAFGYNYNFITSSMLGYELITAPARFALSFFSEETVFWPKMAIFLLGQFVGYFMLGNILNRIVLAVKSKPKQ